MKSAGLAFCVAAAAIAQPVSAAGLLVVSGDEWQLSDNAYAAPYLTGTQQFVNSLANAFGGSNYLFLTGNYNNASSLGSAVAQFATLGKTVSYSPVFSLELAADYDAIFHFGQTITPADIATYVNGGGSAYVSLGGGFYNNDALNEANHWNPMLAQFGLVAGTSYFSVPGFESATVTSGPASSVIWGYGQSIEPLAGPNAGVSYLRGSFLNGPQDIGLVGSSAALVTPGAVPEPESWAMLIAGFGLVGAAMRRRRMAVA